MNKFLVYFREPIVHEKLKEAEANPLIKDSFELSDRVLLVRSTLSNPKHLGEIFSIIPEAEEPSVGVVFRLNDFFWGFYHADLLDWLREEQYAAKQA